MSDSLLKWKTASAAHGPWRGLLTAGLIAVSLGAQALPTRFSSGEAQVALLELYTSEGCSSCPPADRWLSKLQDDPRLWRELIPVALHVDYWDEIGWTDVFASPAHTTRQQDYVRHAGLSQVYTPGLVLQGREWRGWFRGQDLHLPAARIAGPLTIDVLDGSQATIRFVPPEKSANELRYTIALLGIGVESAIGRGENAGKRLRHDFVVLAEHSGPLELLNGEYGANMPLPASHRSAARYALVAWVSRGSDPAPLQAAGGWLTGP